LGENTTEMVQAARESAEQHWDPKIPGQAVRLRDNPGRQGTTTGRTKQAGSLLMVEVDFGPNEKLFKRYDLLEPVDLEEEMFDLLAAGRFGGPIDLRRVLTFEKVKGDLTNVFYSMEASNTDFYPHQFRPVLKFIESPVGRLLIADEVGLGKTIESVYIWKELQARQDARRLLVVCPAMLRAKWRSDLKKRFNIAADIISARDLLGKITDFAERNFNNAFVYIVSLEGLRPPSDFENENKTDPQARFARLLDQHIATDEWALFDLVILDEAHYLRNPATASNRVGRLLREVSHHFVLLTATPIQIASDNLYQLLRLVDPDEFYDSLLFGEVLRANGPVIRALRCLWRLPPDLEAAAEAMNGALSKAYFSNDPVLKRIVEQIPVIGPDAAGRIELARLLESRSLLGQYMTRSRKREVLELEVERAGEVRRQDHAVRYLKMRIAGVDLADPLPVVDEIDLNTEEAVRALSSWFLASVAARAKTWVLDHEADRARGREVQWSANVGVPVEHYDSHAIDVFRSVLAVGWAWLAENDIPHRLDSLITKYRETVATADLDRTDCHAIPEIAAAVHSFIISREAQSGIYVYFDIGGGTVDGVAFNYINLHGERRINFYSERGAPLGVTVLANHLARSGHSQTEKVLVSGDADDLDQHELGVWAKKIQRLVADVIITAKRKDDRSWQRDVFPHPRQPSWMPIRLETSQMAPLPIFVRGGGGGSRWYQQTIRSTYKGFRPHQLRYTAL
jgi:hypothetical protein